MLKLLRINLILFSFLVAISYRYTPVKKFYYVFIVFLLFILILHLSKNRISIKNFTNYFMFMVIVAIIYTVINSKYNLRDIYKYYIIMYATIFYLYYALDKYGFEYAKRLYKQFTIVLNIFSILNLYQVFFKIPIFEKYMVPIGNSYSYNFHQSNYRTLSAFGHPIIAGLFFAALFFCNLYLIKNSLKKYILEFIVLINIYSTMSRSVWIAFLIGLIFYILINIRKIFSNFKDTRFTYRKLFLIYLSIIFIVVVAIYIICNSNIISNSIMSRFGDSLSSNSTDPSNLQRTGTINLVMNYMLSSNIYHLIFGYGFDTMISFMLAHPLYIIDFGSTDNTYLAIFYQYGLLGIIAYIVLFIKICIKFFKYHKKSWIIELSFINLVVINIIIFFFEFPEWQTVSIFLMFILCCLTFPCKNYNNKNVKINKKLS
ncbi:O-antigen ligase family protein [Clostridium tyrobutyricum]|uniref:O-antigen ligase family protein n=1 Tax=Clostridium tyrobutyricum TaxID=1519 RepID=UPI0039F6FA9B